jgi:sugar/nucleoside kinase (ribokinase family)
MYWANKPKEAANMSESTAVPPLSGKDLSVCVMGNLNIDLIIRGVSALPAWGHEVSGRDYTVVSSGQAGYLALALGNLDIQPLVVGNVGDDAFGRLITGDLQAVDVDVAGVEVTAGGTTGITVGVVRTDGERSFISDFACLGDFSAALVERQWANVERAGIVCLVGLFNLPSFTLDDAAALMQRAKSSGKITMLDTGWDPNNWPPATINGIKSLLRDVRIFMPNSDEALVITGASTVEEAADILLAHGPELVIVKNGGKGSYARYRSETLVVPAIPTTVYDTVGAGDVFNGGFLYGFTHGWGLEKSMAFGNAASSLYIARQKGRRYPTEAETLEQAKKLDSFNR